MLIIANRQRIVACVVITRVRAGVVRVHYAIACSRPCASRHKHRDTRTQSEPRRRPSFTRAAGRTSRRVANTRPSPSAWEALERQTDAVSHTDKPMALYYVRGPPACELTEAPVKPLPAFDKPADVYAVAIRRATPSFAGDRFIRCN